MVRVRALGRRRPRSEEPPLKAAPSDQLVLLDLQQHDSTLAQLAHRRRALPEHEQLAALAVRRDELEGRRIEAETTVSDLGADQRKADGEVELVKTRRARNQQRLDSGQISSPKDLAGLQHELIALDRRISDLEDAELEVMEALELAEATLADVRHDVEAIDADVARLTASRDAAVADLDAAARTAFAEREAVAAVVPEPLLALYTRLREQQGGLAAAALRQQRCEGCRLELNAADLREIVATADDEVLRCPECNRILVRTPESGLKAPDQ